MEINTPKTVAKGNIDVQADIDEINAGLGVLKDGNIITSSGRVYGFHPEKGNYFLRSGSIGSVDLSQAEFGILKQMINAGGLTGNAKKAFDNMLNKGNNGLNSDSKAKLIDLYNSRQ